MMKSGIRRLAGALAVTLATGLLAAGCVVRERDGYDGSYGNDRGYDRRDDRRDERRDERGDRGDDRRDWGRRD